MAGRCRHVAAIVLYAALPGNLLIGPRWVIPGLELAILGAVVVNRSG